MNRRGFFGLLGKLVAVGAAMAVASAILEPLQAKVAVEIAPKLMTLEELMLLANSKPNWALAS